MSELLGFLRYFFLSQSTAKHVAFPAKTYIRLKISIVWSVFTGSFMSSQGQGVIRLFWLTRCMHILLEFLLCFSLNSNEPPHDKTNKMACMPSEDSDQPGHPPSLIRVFAVPMKKAQVLSYPLSAQRRLWSDLADCQADPSLRWARVILLVLSCGSSGIKLSRTHMYW